MRLNQKGYRGAKHHRRTIPVYVILILFTQVAFVFGAADSEKPTADRSRVYKLNHRRAEEVKNCLLQLEIGRRVDALSENILIVTSDQPADLIRTSSILQVLDKQAPRSLRQWVPAPDAGLPDRSYLYSKLNLAEINFGTLLDPPPVNAAQPIILDTHGDNLVALADEEIISRIDLLIQEWTSRRLEELSRSVPAPEPNQPAPAAASAAESPAPAQIVPAVPEPKTGPEPNVAAPAEMELLPAPARISVEPTAAQTRPAEPNSEEDFFSRELLKALSAAQEKAEDLQEAIEAEKQKTGGTAEEQITQETQARTEEDEAYLEIIEELRRKSTAMPEEEQPAEPKPQEIAAEPTPAEVPQPSKEQPVSDLARLQEQLARQEQQIAELKALLTERIRQPEKKVQAASQISEPEIPEGETELELTITLPEKVEITWLLELVGKQLGLNYMYDPTQVKGDVTLKIHDGKIKVKDAYALLESVLRFRGFVMTRRGSLVTIVPSSQIKQAEPVIRGPEEPIEPGDVIVSSVFQLKNITPAAAQKMLTDMQLGTAFVIVAETNSLIVTDYTYRMDRVEQVIKLVDVAGEPKTFQYRQLQYTSAAEMVGKLKTLTAQIGGVSVSGGAPASEAAPVRATPTPVQRDARGRVIAPQPGQAETPAPAPAAAAAGASAQETVYLDTDDRTNRIVMIGYPAQIKIINELIDTLDVPKYYIRYVREYFIQHVEAAEIVTAMNELGLANVVVGDQSAAARTTTPTRAVPTRPGQPGQPVQPVQPAAAAQTAGGEDQPYISIRPNTNSLLVNATKEQHDAIELVIMHVDVKQKDQRTIHEYEIQNVDARQIVKTMEDLGIISPGRSSQENTAAARGGTTGRSLTGRQMGAAQPVQEPGQPELPLALPTMEGETVRELTAAEPQIAILESTNSLLVNATPRQHQAIALIIAHVDRTLEQISTPYVVYPLENQDPEKLAGVLNELIQETVEQAQKSAPDAKIQTAGTPAATAQLPTREEERIRIIADAASYSLIVYANKKNQQWVGELIKELDQYRPQVLLDVMLVEVTKVDQFNYDLDLISSLPNLQNTSGTLDYTIGGSNVGAVLGKLNTTDYDRKRFIEGVSRSGDFTGFYGSENIMALLTLMQSKNYGRVLNRPKLLVNDNEEGSITLEQVTYREIKQTTIIGSDTPQTAESVDYKDYSAGITLKIKPHISKGDQLRLEITLNRSDFNIKEGADPALPPDKINSDVGTVITVPDKNTIILGGLERISQSKGGSKTPILGDIPLIGGLFRSIGNSDDQRKIYIFIKANILRPGENMSSNDLKEISNKNREQFEAMESEMQTYQDWPGIDSPSMPPRKILEGDKVGTSEEEALY
jgi:type II secretory pathway component GspD/PulD (secretin)